MKLSIGASTKHIAMSTPNDFTAAMRSPLLTANVSSIIDASDHTALVKYLHNVPRPYAICILTTKG